MTEASRMCPACGTPEARPFLELDRESVTGEPYRVVTCTACGLHYTTPLPTPKELSELYAEGFYSAGNAQRPKPNALHALLQEGIFWQHRQAFAGRRPGRILDVGCGDGEFLRSLKARGWEVHGTETSSAACAIAGAKGIDVFPGALVDAHFPDRFFDVITLWHVLEHLPEPKVELKEIHRILADDGLLVIEVPNSASPTLRFCGTKWYPLDAPRHLQHFKPSTLKSLLDHSGFEWSDGQNYHFSDTTYAAYSIIDRMNLKFRPTGVRHLTDNLQPIGPLEKLLSIGFTGLILLACIPYPLLTILLTGNSELMTVVAKKSRTP
jgi:2-polyprenyl-3-methyl-5-hydroxy-6-metoxy-1,4-benzoquinol methylase